jgi:phage-related protein
MADGSVKIDVDLDKDPAIRGAQDINKEFGNMAKSISGMMKDAGKNLTKYVTVPLAGMAIGMGKAAMDLEATEAKYYTVFGNMSDQSDAFIKEFQKLTPATKAEARSMASGIQDLLVPMGFAREEATGMTGEFMHVAGALANFNSGTHSAEDVTNALSSAITGQYKSLQGLGIQLDATTVKNKAVEMGLMGAGEEMTNQIRTQVLLAEVYNQSGDALAAYTEENLDAKTKMGLLKSEIIDVAAEIGTAFLPAINGVLDILRSAVTWVSNLSDEQLKLAGIIATVAAAIGPLLLAGSFMIDKFMAVQSTFSTLTTAISKSGGMMGMLKGAIGALFSPIGLVVGALGALVALFVYAYNTNEVLRDSVNELTSAFGNLLNGTGSFSEVFEALHFVIYDFLTAIETLLPELIWMGVDIVFNLLDGINQAMPGVLEKAVEVMTGLLNGFIEFLPQMIEIGSWALRNLAEGLSLVIPYLIETAINIALNLLDAFISFLPTMLDTGKKFLQQVIRGLIDTLPDLLATGLQLILDLIQLFIRKLPEFIERGKKLVSALKDGLIAMLPDLIQGGVELMVKLLAKILEYAPKLLTAGVDLIWEFIKGMTSLTNDVVGAIIEIGAAIISEAKNIDLLSIGKDIVRGLWDGISSMGGWLGEKVGGFFSGVTDKVKGVFGVKSPSRVFRDEIGEMLPQGMVVGVEAEERQTARRIGKSFEGTVSAAMKAVQRVKQPQLSERAVASVYRMEGRGQTGSTVNNDSRKQATIHNHFHGDGAVDEREMQRRARLEWQKLGYDFA